MRKMFKDDFSLEDTRNLKCLQKKDQNTIVALLSVIGIIILTAAIVGAVIKFKKKYDYEEDFSEGFCDENGCYYADEEDFE